MTFETDFGYGCMHLYLALHPKKSTAYDPTEEGYISDEEESRLHHFAEFVRYRQKLDDYWTGLEKSGMKKEELDAVVFSMTEEGWKDFQKHFEGNVKGEIRFDSEDLPQVFAKFRDDVCRICKRPVTQLEMEIAKSLGWQVSRYGKE